MAASLRNVLSFILKTRPPTFLHVNSGINVTTARGKSRWLRPVLKQLYKRRIEQGPEPERHRSVWSNWNYESELYAFGKRLGEDFHKNTLRTAFTHRSYVEAEEVKWSGLGLGSAENALELEDNSTLHDNGAKLTSSYVVAYLKHCLPKVPDHGIQSIHDTLTSDESLAFLAKNLGFSDLILCTDFPPTNETLSRTFKAVVGALEQDQGSSRACKLVEDIVLTQLVGQCVEDIWDVVNPMGLLTDMLASQNRGLPEPRMIWQTGCETVLSTYLVGVYSDQQLIGKGYGETVGIAEEMAARAALRKLFAMGPEQQPFKFGQSNLPVVEL